MLVREIASRSSLIREFLDARLPALPKLAGAVNKRLETRQPVVGFKGEAWQYALIGSAVDFRLRAFFSPNFHENSIFEKGIARSKTWYSIEFFNEKGESNKYINPFHRRAKRGDIIRNLLCAYEEFIGISSPKGSLLSFNEELRLASFYFLFANIEAVARGMTPPMFLYRVADENPEKMIASVPEIISRDIAEMGMSLFDRYSVMFSAESIHLGGGLAGSDDVSGADFDLVVDGSLIEVKVSIRSRIKVDWLRQIAGYWLLDYNDEYRIRTAILELPRHRYSERFDIERDFLAGQESGAVRRSFLQALGKQGAVAAGL